MPRLPEDVLDCVWRISCWAHTLSGTQGLPGLVTQELRAERSQQLRTLLRKNPTWRLGHLELGEESLFVDDVGTAYASACAVIFLESNSSQPSRPSLLASRAKFLLGRCYLRRGDPKRALQIFTQESNAPSLLWKIKEETAAAYMALGDTQSALSTLLAIPDEKLTPEGAAARAYLRKKQDGTLDSGTYTT